MQDLEKIFYLYLSGIKDITAFIQENFGTNNILVNKNRGLFRSHRYGIKDSKIKGYSFHGTGCSFQLKNHSIDIEFSEDDFIGFTNWGFYLFVKRYIQNISEYELDDFLEIMRKKGTIIKKEKLYIVGSGNFGA